MASENGLWIPDSIWEIEGLSFMQKGFVAAIDSLDNDRGCFASNGYFSEKFGVTKDRASKIIQELKELGILSVQINKGAGYERVIKVISLSVKTPIGEKADSSMPQHIEGIGEKADTLSASTQIAIGEKAEQIIQLKKRDITKVITKGEGACAHTAPSDSDSLNDPKKEAPQLRGTPQSKATQKAQQTKAARAADEATEIIYPFDTPDFRLWWGHWLDHRTIKGCAYASKKSEQTALHQLAQFSEGFCIELIQTSIASGWQGLIFPRTKDDYKKYLKRQENDEHVNNGGGTAAGGFDMGQYARMVASSSANPERYKGANAAGQNAAGAQADEPHHGSGYWRHSG
ncbi:helix-turn-helix domain-containing protein [Rufibacter roseus]|uniref:Helix-turn-helix domain-containing protein n=1 Tax=Rufibacter roseus TaxID=1567108 RepID=A0ABW2DNT9_9BACT|nr:helix-turn-helix domain-containing protein [Rufibacter roseus]